LNNIINNIIILLLLSYLPHTTVTFTNVFLECTFVACSNKLYCCIVSWPWN